MEIKKFISSFGQQLMAKEGVATLTTESATKEDLAAVSTDLGVMLDEMSLEDGGGLTSDEKLTVESALMASSGVNLKNTVDSMPSKMQDAIIKGDLTTESASGGKITNITIVNKIFNSVPSKQDEFAEGFFPTVIKDPKETAVKVYARVPSYFTSWDGKGKEKTSMIELTRETGFLVGEENRVYPIWAAELSDVLDEDNKYVPAGSTVESAPIKFGEKVDLLEISSDEAAISGSINTTRALSPSLTLETLYIANSDNSAKVKVDVSGFKTAGSTMTAEGKDEDYQINFTADEMTLPASAFKKADGTALIAGNYKLVYATAAMFRGNLEYASCQGDASAFKLLRVVDESGDTLAAGAEREAIETAVAGLGLVSYSVIAYEDNGDLAAEGKIFTMDNESELYDVPFRTPNSVKGTIADLYGGNDATQLASMVTSTGHMTSAHAVEKLLDVVAKAKWAVDNGGADTLKGIGNRFVKPFHKSVDLDLSKSVSNRESSDLEGSITGALVSAIKNAALQASRESGLAAAMDVVYPGRKIRCTVGTDKTIVSYLRSEDSDIIKVSKNLEIQVVSTANKKMDGKIIGAFTPSVDRNIPDFLSLGFCGWSPAVVVDTNRTIANRTTKCVSAFPQFKHHSLTNIIFEINVQKLDELISKI